MHLASLNSSSVLNVFESSYETKASEQHIFMKYVNAIFKGVHYIMTGEYHVMSPRHHIMTNAHHMKIQSQQHSQS